MPPSTGQMVGPYEIQEQLGSGGMGVVYRAHDTRLDRPVAVKFISEKALSKGKALERFGRESRVASAINHPGICTVYDIGEYEGAPYLVMEYLEGESLWQRLQKTRTLPYDILLELGVQVADALAAAHSRGILHRDIKPANIFLTKDGRAKILDFGVAKRLDEAEDRNGADGANLQTTVTGFAMGTAQHMSPEQARGDDVDVRTDLFSFGTVLYQCASGQPPFRGPSAAVVLEMIQTQTVETLTQAGAGVPAEFDAIVMRCLEKDRRKRYQLASELRSDLEMLRAGLNQSGAVPLAPPLRRRQAGRWLAGALAVAAACALYLSQRDSVPAPVLHLKRLTANSPDLPVLTASVSPDGGRVAFGDQTGVSLLEMGTGEITQLAGLAGYLPMQWERGGAALLLSRPGEEDLYARVPVSVPAELSPVRAGFFLPVQSPNQELALEIRRSGTGAGFSLWLLRRSDGAERKLLDGPPGFQETDFCWLPGDRFVTFTSSFSFGEQKPGWRLNLLDVESGKVLELEPSPGVRQLSNAVWSARGEVLFGLMESSSLQMQLWSAALTSSGNAFRGKPRQLSAFEDMGFFRLHASGDGRKIVARFFKQQGDIYIAELASVNRLQSPPRRLTYDLRDDALGAWMPDGQRIIFAANRTGSSDLYRQSINDGNAENFVGGSAFTSMPRICGQDKYLVYSSFEQSNPDVSRLMVTPLAGGPTRVVHTTDKLYGLRSIAGFCAMEIHDGNKEHSIHEVDAETGAVRELFRVYDPSSPTAPVAGGKQFMQYDRSTGGMVVLDRAGARVGSYRVRLLRGEILSRIESEYAGNGVYAATLLPPAGTRLLHVSIGGEVTEVFRSLSHGSGYAVSSPDGRRLALYLRHIDSNLWLLEGL